MFGMYQTAKLIQGINATAPARFPPVLLRAKAVSTHRTKERQAMIPFVEMIDSRGQKISVNPEIVQFVRTADNMDNECLIVFGKDQLLRVRGTLDEVTNLLRRG